jgi:acetyltransferase-like isoleucine patch superfamily enzyme
MDSRIDLVLERGQDVRIRTNKLFREILSDYGVFTKRQHSELTQYKCRWNDGDLITTRKDANIESYVSIASGNSLFSTGSFSSIASSLPVNARVGRYVSIAPNCRVMGFKHPVEAVSTSSISYQEDREMLRAYRRDLEKSGVKDFNFRKVPTPQENVKLPITIGHDVWIASHVTLKGSVKIGQGAVIASGAVVTKDIPPYAIVGGNPAKIIKMRFPEEIIRLLIESEWWQYDPNTLHQFDMSNPEKFATDLIKEKANLTKFQPRILNIWNLISSADVDTEISSTSVSSSI